MECSLLKNVPAAQRISVRNWHHSGREFILKPLTFFVAHTTFTHVKMKGSSADLRLRRARSAAWQ